MINAVDAYKKAKKANEKRKRKCERKDDRDVKKAIKRAIKYGYYEVEVRDISEKLISKLEAEQYVIVEQKDFHTGRIVGYKIKWENNMITAEELQAQKMSAMRRALRGAMRDSIQAQQEKLDELEKQLESADELDDIDKPLDIDSCDTVYYVTEAGTISIMYGATPNVPFYNARHRAFKQVKYAEMYREKTQVIADLLHFKWLYDRDYEPDWGDDDEHKFCVWYDHEDNIYRIVRTRICEHMATVYFGTNELAQKCADWLNKKAGII